MCCYGPFEKGLWERQHPKPGVTYYPVKHFNLWLDSLFKYGMTLEEAKKILEENDYCGEKFTLKQIDWPLKKQKPPTPGPYYGIYHILENGLEPHFAALLIANGDIMECGAEFMFGGATMQWFALPGHPKVIEFVKKRMTKGEEKFAELYWECLYKIKNFLKTRHTEEELYSFLNNVQRELPPQMMIFAEARENYHFFYGDNIEMIDEIKKCQLESKIRWDKVVAIQLDTYDFNYFKDDGSPVTNPDYTNDRPSSWEVYLLSNVYISEGKIVGVMFSESTFYGCTPWPSQHFIALGYYDFGNWYPESAYYFWTFD